MNEIDADNIMALYEKLRPKWKKRPCSREHFRWERITAERLRHAPRHIPAPLGTIHPAYFAGSILSTA